MASKKIDVTCVGEIYALAKSISSKDNLHISQEGMPVFAILLSVLKNKVHYIGAVGADELGELIVGRLNKFGVNTKVIKERSIPTSIAIDFYNEGKKVNHYRKADKLITPGQLKPSHLNNAKICHISYHGLSQDPARLSIYRATEIAIAGGAEMSIDLNYSDNLWKKAKKGRRISEKYIGMGAHVLLSDFDYENIFRHIGRSAEKIIDHLLGLGAKSVSLLIPEHGIWCADQTTESFLPRKIDKSESVNYCSQAYWAGYLTGYLNDKSLVESAKIGKKMMDYNLKLDIKSMKQLDWRKLK